MPGIVIARERICKATYESYNNLSSISSMRTFLQGVPDFESSERDILLLCNLVQ